MSNRVISWAVNSQPDADHTVFYQNNRPIPYMKVNKHHEEHKKSISAESNTSNAKWMNVKAAQIPSEREPQRRKQEDCARDTWDGWRKGRTDGRMEGWRGRHRWMFGKKEVKYRNKANIVKLQAPIVLYFKACLQAHVCKTERERCECNFKETSQICKWLLKTPRRTQLASCD